jgi:hypothetical protein
MPRDAVYGFDHLIMVKPDREIWFDVMHPCRVKLCTAFFDHHDITVFLRKYEEHYIKKTIY